MPTTSSSSDRVAEVAARLHGPPVFGWVSRPDGSISDVLSPLDELQERHVAVVWYWYERGDYDGRGAALLLRGGGGWADHDMGHCSCYGPWENLPSDGAFVSSLGELIGKWSAERAAEMWTLVAAARAYTEQ